MEFTPGGHPNHATETFLGGRHEQVQGLYQNSKTNAQDHSIECVNISEGKG